MAEKWGYVAAEWSLMLTGQDFMDKVVDREKCFTCSPMPDQHIESLQIVIGIVLIIPGDKDGLEGRGRNIQLR